MIGGSHCGFIFAFLFAFLVAFFAFGAAFGSVISDFRDILLLCRVQGALSGSEMAQILSLIASGTLNLSILLILYDSRRLAKARSARV
jgi:hypothetical protein